MRWRLDDGQIEVVDDAVAEVLRRLSPRTKLEAISDYRDTIALMIRALLRTEHPEWEPEQLSREVARRLLGETD